MDAEIKAKWLDALRSGEYKQGQFALQCSGKFCCLGVLCDLVSPEEWEAGNRGDLAHNGRSNYPTESVLERALLDENRALDVAVLNDQGQSFLEIADYIKEHF